MMLSESETRFTAISLSPDPPRLIERREGKRHIAVLQAGKIIAGNDEELCLIRNISSGGMMASVYGSLGEGERVTIAFKAGESVGGQVIWFREGMVGFRFDQPIDVHDMLVARGLAAGAGFAPRAPRLNVCGLALVHSGGEDFGVQVLDISQSGVKIEAVGFGGIDDDVIVKMAGLPACPGVVRWQDGDHAGISFNRTLPLDQIALWAAAQTPRHAETSTYGEGILNAEGVIWPNPGARPN